MMTARIKGLLISGVLMTWVLMLFGVCVGSAGFDPLWKSFLSGAADPSASDMMQQIIWDIRLPRTLGAWAAGALLGLAGALAQGLFRNPLADPYLLGSGSGACLGVALALALLSGGSSLLGGAGMMNAVLPIGVFSSNIWVRVGLTGSAFMGAVVAVLLTMVLAKGLGNTLRLLLSGVIVGVVLGALTHLVTLGSPESLQAMQTFMLGSTAFVGWNSALLMLLIWLACWFVSWLLARVLDGLSLGDSTAFTLGLPVATLRMALVAVLALATGTAVAQTGLIAFVGLASPHLIRSLVKTTHQHLMILASLAGGVLLLCADILARGLMAPQELPVGVLTAVIGGGYLLWLMYRDSPQQAGVR
jgi:iron complex transport system permease protein